MKIIRGLFLTIALLLICSCKSNETPVWEIIGSISAGDGDVHEVDLSDNIAYIADGFDGLHIINLNDPENPEEIGYIDPYPSYSTVADTFYHVEVKGNIAYILVYQNCSGWCMGRFGELRIYDVSQPNSPIILSSVDIVATDIAIEGDFVYVTHSDYGFMPVFSIIDVSEYQNPQIISSIPINSEGSLVKRHDNVFISVKGFSDFEGLIGVNVYDPLSPVLLLSQDWTVLGNPSVPFIINDETGYVAIGENGIQQYDISDPANTLASVTVMTSSPANDIDIYGKYMYVATDNGVEIFDISEPENPLFTAEIPTDTPAIKVRVDGNLGIVVTEKVEEQSEYGSSIIEQEKLSVFLIPERENRSQ
ncbi:MAG: hypothetical protein JW927_14425 [Deltaproteobacteria bacterium]|nr:hypothetical protein [Deltaproteobacteria bacterium]